MLFLCVSVYCHRVTTQLQLINIIIIIITSYKLQSMNITNNYSTAGKGVRGHKGCTLKVTTL